MSLFLVSKDRKVKEALDRQLHKETYFIDSLQRLREAKQLIHTDECPVILIDDSLSSLGYIPPLETILSYNMRGLRILLSRQLTKPFVEGEIFALLRKPIVIRHLVELINLCSYEDALHGYLDTDQQCASKQRNKVPPFIGETDSMKRIRSIIQKIGPLFRCVHISGESGTGKEVVAHLLRHQAGVDLPYVVMNCSNIPPTLADTTLFGHVKGAYTNAVEEKDGIVKAADGGILFLDELEDLHPEVQGKLLRLLETGQYRRVGSSEILHSHFKIITASNVPLITLVEQKKFRFDLYNRLHHLVISLPPLRERKEDIPLLIDYHLKQIGEHRVIENTTMQRIMNYHWPGNVRELFKEVELLSVFASNDLKPLSYREILTDSVLNSYVADTEIPYSI